MGFFEGLAGLNGDGTVYFGVCEFGYEVGGEKVATEGGHRVVDPRVFGGDVAPEVMVGVNDCGWWVGHFVSMVLASGARRNLSWLCCAMAALAMVRYSLEMRVRMLYFGVLRERLGGGEARLELGDGATVAEVLSVYRERLADFSWESIAVAVNREYAKADVVLKDGDEVALLPPVSGGAR